VTQYLFNRQWTFTIGAPGDQGSAYSSLRVKFDIDKTSKSESNKAKFEVYGLNAASRQKYEKKGLQAQFDAGYVGLVGTIFVGDVALPKTDAAKQQRDPNNNKTKLAASEKREGREIITTFECGDGEKFLTTAHFSKSYPAGTLFLQVMQDLADTINATGISIGQVLGITTATFAKGIALHGSVKKVMDYLVTQQGLEWSIQNGFLQVQPITAHDGDTAIVLSEDTGLIGVPTRGADHTEFRCLINPKMKPGGYVQIYSENINGEFFKLRRTHFMGDTHGNQWEIECEAVPIKAVQTYTTNAGVTLRAGP
jgi:hypothetical protein